LGIEPESAALLAHSAPMIFYSEVVDHAVINKIVEETNIYAIWTLSLSISSHITVLSRLHSWEQTTAEEIQRILGLLCRCV
jgi:hypothetical protein